MSKQLVLLGLALSAVTLLALTYVLPPPEDFHIQNPAWNGLTELRERYGVMSVRNLTELAGEGTLLIIGPSEDYGEEELEALRIFVTRGNTVVLADDFGKGNQVLSYLGLNIRFNGSLLADPLFKEKAKYLPKAFLLEPHAGKLQLNYATIVEGSGYEPLALSSEFSYLDLNLNGKYDEGEPAGPFVVAARAKLGEGYVIVVSDSSIFINAMLDEESNDALLRSLIGGGAVYLDVGHWRLGSLSLIKSYLATIYEVLKAPELKYALAVVLIAISSKVTVKRVRRGLSEVSKVLSEHPHWDRRVLEKLWEELRRGRP